MHIQPCLLILCIVTVRVVYSPGRHEGESGSGSIRTDRVDSNEGISVFLFSMVKGAWDMYEHRRGGTREWFRLDI